MTLRVSLSAIERTRVLFLMISLAVLSFFLLPDLIGSDVSVAGSSAGDARAEQIQEEDQDANKPHSLFGSYYSTQNGMTATMLLNNKGNQPLEVRPTIYNMSGQAIEIPAVWVEASSFRFVNLKEWAEMGGESFSQGSVRLFHVGKDLVLGAQIYLTDEANSLSFEEKLAEFDNFDSRRFEGVWWMPSRQAEVQIVLSNTTDAPLSVTARLAKRPHQTNDAQLIQLGAHETRVLDLRQDFAGGEHFAKSEIVALSLEHAGAKSALLARAMVKEATNGYSNVVQFSNPNTGKSREYQGVGFQIADVNGEQLAPVIVARNLGSEVATVRARVPYTRINNTTGVVELPQTKLRAGEMTLLDTHKVKQRSQQEQIQIAGLEIEYDTAPGSVVVNAHSVSTSGNQVYRVPLWDPLGQRSPTGGYPWHIEGTSTTKTYIKNITDREQYYVASLRWPNAEGYMIGMKKIGPHQTVEIDVKRLRDEQVPDVSGRLIPLDQANGQLMWSLKQVGPPPAGEEGRQALALIGRSEQVDVERGVSSNYACQSCCSNSYNSSFLSPGSSENEADALVSYTVMQKDKDCYGTLTLAYPHDGPVFWSTVDPTVATVDSFGVVTAVGAGETTVKANWTDYRYDMRFVMCSNFGAGAPNCYDCNQPVTVSPTPQATQKVKPRITSITPSRGVAGVTTTVTIAGRGFRSPVSASAGSGITASNVTVNSSTSITADFAVAANATGGNRAVTVTCNNKTSNNDKTFFVQIPSEFIPLNLATANLGCPTGAAGFGAEVTYQVADQAGQAITVSGMTPQERFTVNGTLAFNDFRAFATPQTTDANGTFLDTPVGTCAGPPPPSFNFCVDVVQTFNIVVGSTTFTIPTTTTRRDCMQGIRVVVTTGTVSRTSSLGTVN